MLRVLCCCSDAAMCSLKWLQLIVIASFYRFVFFYDKTVIQEILGVMIMISYILQLFHFFLLFFIVVSWIHTQQCIGGRARSVHDHFGTSCVPTSVHRCKLLRYMSRTVSEHMAILLRYTDQSECGQFRYIHFGTLSNLRAYTTCNK